MHSCFASKSHLARVGKYFGSCLVREASWIAGFCPEKQGIHEVTQTHTKLVATEIDF